MSEHASRVHVARRGAKAGRSAVAEPSGEVKVSPLAWLATLSQRVLSALVLIPVVIALVWFGGWVAFAGALITLAVAMWELRQMFAHKEWRPPLILSTLAGIAFLLLAELWHQGVAPVRLALLAGAALSPPLLVSSAWLILPPLRIEGRGPRPALVLATPLFFRLPPPLFPLLPRHRGARLHGAAAGAHDDSAACAVGACRRPRRAGRRCLHHR